MPRLSAGVHGRLQPSRPHSGSRGTPQRLRPAVRCRDKCLRSLPRGGCHRDRADGSALRLRGVHHREPWVIVLALAHNYERLKEFLPTRPTVSVSPISVINTRGAREPPMPWQIGFAPGLQRQCIPGTIGGCAAPHSARHCLRIGGTRQARLLDQPPLRLGCASRRRHH